MQQNKYSGYKGNAIDLADLFRKIAFHWPLYLVMILIGVAGAFIYLKYAKPRYASTAKLYLKDEEKGGDELDALKSLSIINSGKNIENEMEMLKSPILVEQVIKDNAFNIRYFQKGTVRNTELYNTSPILLRKLGVVRRQGNYSFDVTTGADKLDVKFTDEDKESSSNFIVAPDQPFRIGADSFAISYKNKEADAGRRDYRIAVDSVAEMAYDKIEDISTMLVNKDATVVLVNYQDRVAARSADFINALLEAYNEFTLSDKNRVSLKTMRFLEGRIDSLRDELGLLERQEETFKVKRGITDIEASSKLALEQVKDADIRLNDANMQLSVYDEVENYINDPTGRYPFAPVLGSVDPSLTAMINRYEELQKERKRLSLSLQPSSVIVQNLDTQISDARSTVRDYIAGYRRNANVAQKKMQAKVNEIQGRIANIPSYERQYINLKRQQGVKENLYLYLLKKKEEASVAYASNVVDNKVIAPAFIPNKPISPKKTLVFIAFIAGALLLTTLYVYIKYFLNTRILSKKEIEQAFEYPVIAEIYQQDEDGSKRILLPNRPILVEQILNLRTNLKFLLSEHATAPTSILFTSSISGEGKTFLTAHLGHALTANNKKVVLMELDLRKPKLSNFLGLDNSVGITNYLVENKSVDDIIKKVPGADGLYLVSSGPIPPNPVELIEGNNMRLLLAELRERFDYLLIDTAPIGIVSDAKSLSPYIDCTLFVVRYDFTLKSKLASVAENIKEGVFKKTGVIFNGIDQDTFYPYYYYDQYTYMNDKPKVKWPALLKKIRHRIV
ncbi:polysaccharide biosynthesis tyrosine autokinase [Chitinophaga pendula]|uniref:GumC family protein n=1 Tax=Chitinophaga TaxID=79328 RepID=UPI000BAF486E|nr:MULTISPECIES: polysaccharide biosynthesis tyrosine autokinase [Chitinophaga]ASZ14193.1 hypothetical protein CK934_26195 [Chitinophaga sp. MD30]UCJ08171.1 polysaccharide biosynthesis tyrosine autokinase [Chitinophaga pendula]